MGAQSAKHNAIKSQGYLGSKPMAPEVMLGNQIS